MGREPMVPDGLWDSVCPGLDCLTRRHIWVSLEDPAIPCTQPGEVAQASWCLWCGTGVSNEHEAGWGAGTSGTQDPD